MLRITEQRESEPGSVVLRLEGRLAGLWVEVLNTSCRQILAREQQCVVVDLTGVTFIDADGKAILSRLWGEGVTLRASGCMTKCVVEEITGVGRSDSETRKSEGTTRS
jgi:anti-anti-sigma regulatory factor